MNFNLLQTLTFLFQRFLPLWILTFAALAFLAPNFFAPFAHFPPFALGFIFFLMGMTISFESFVEVFKRPKVLLIGMGLKWLLTVVVSVALAFIFFREEGKLAAGVILAGVVPSGTSANVYTLLADGTVALSLTLASIDTFIAPFMTPFLMELFAGQFIPITFLDLFLNIIYIVFIPIACGMLIQLFLAKQIQKVRPVFSLLSIFSLFVIVLGVIVGAYESVLSFTSTIPLLLVVVFIQVAFPMAASYYIAKWFGAPEASCRAILFHVGICNTALSSTLALSYIDPLAAVPSVLNMITNLSLGAAVANWFARKPMTTEKNENHFSKKF